MSNNNYKSDLSHKKKIKLSKTVISTIPWLIVSGLLWAGVFVKPTVTIQDVEKPAIEPRDNIYGLDVVDNKSIWLVGSYGKVLRSDDSGNSWFVQKTHSEKHLQDVSAWDSDKAIAVGNAGIVFITENAGRTWKEVNAPKNDIANKLLRVHAYSNGEAWSVGEYGTIIRTKNYGNSWERMRESEDVILNDIVKFGSNKVVAVGEFGTILISEDDGLTWAQVELDFDIESSLMAIDFRDQFNGVAVGLDGLIIQTEDGGVTWKQAVDGDNAVSEHLMDVIWDEKRNNWFSVGNKGVWVEFDQRLKVLESGVFDQMDLSWHTEINLINDKYLTVGANVGLFNPDNNNFFESNDKLVR